MGKLLISSHEKNLIVIDTLYTTLCKIIQTLLNTKIYTIFDVISDATVSKYGKFKKSFLCI